MRATAILRVMMLAAAALAPAGCGDDVAGPPRFDLSMATMEDMAVVNDLAITTAGVVRVGAGGGNVFAPATVTIQAGQGVTWDWISGFHSVVSDSMPKAWDDSPGQASGQFVVMFPTAGTFPYHCGVHGMMMTGTVVVQ